MLNQKKLMLVEQPVVVDLETSNEVRSQSDFSVRGVSGMTISNSNGVEKYSFDPTQNYSTNTIPFFRNRKRWNHIWRRNSDATKDDNSR